MSQAWLWALPGERLGEMMGLKSKGEDIGTGSLRRAPVPRVQCSLELSRTCKEAGGFWMLGMG